MPEITITLKVSGGSNFDLSVQESTTIGEVKAMSEEHCKFPAEQQRIIFKGRILKDTDTLGQHSIKSGNVLHLVKGASAEPAPAAAPAAAAAPASASSTGASAGAAPAAANPAGFDASQGFSPFGMFNPAAGGNPAAAGQMPMYGMPGGVPGMGMAGVDPATMAQVMQSPLFQNMMQSMAANPQMFAQMMQGNPMLAQMMQSNPQLAAVMSNPELLRLILSPQVQQAVWAMQQAGLTGAPGMGMPGALPGAGHAAGAGGNVGAGAQGGNQAANQAANAQAAAAMLAMMGGQGQAGGMPGYPGMPGMFGMPQQGAGHAAQPGAAPQGGMPQQQPQIPAQTAAHLRDLAGRFEGELRQMEAMGFTDKFANLEALNACDGNVELAINLLFSNTMGDSGSDASPTNDQ